MTIDDSVYTSPGNHFPATTTTWAKEQPWIYILQLLEVCWPSQTNSAHSLWLCHDQSTRQMHSSINRSALNEPSPWHTNLISRNCDRSVPIEPHLAHKLLASMDWLHAKLWYLLSTTNKVLIAVADHHVTAITPWHSSVKTNPTWSIPSISSSFLQSYTPTFLFYITPWSTINMETPIAVLQCCTLTEPNITLLWTP